MSFGLTDWAAEVRRIKAAFKIESPCYFADTMEPEIGLRSFTLYSPSITSEVESPNFPLIGDAELSVEYGEEYRFYSLDRLLENRGGWDVTEVMMRWDNSIIRIQRSDSYAPVMAEALFCLGLLTPEIERELEVAISAHQKAEWTLQYDKRLEAAQ